MAETPPEQDTGCRGCDIAWNVLMVLGALTVAFIAFDTLTNGKGTEALLRLGHQVRPKLAAVIPIREEGQVDDSAG